MNVIQTALAGVDIIEPKVFGDERGFFLETFQKERYQKLCGIDLDFVQDNHSRSARGVLRGLHFQKTKPQGKLVRVVSGEVFDVAVDINPDSPTYGQYEGVILSSENKRQFIMIQAMKGVCCGMMPMLPSTGQSISQRYPKKTLLPPL